MMIPPRMVSPSSIRRTRMRSWSGVKVVVTDVDAIASLLLQVPAGLSPGRGFGVITRKKLWKLPGVGPRSIFARETEQFCRRGASSQAFQLLKIGKLDSVVKCGLLIYECYTLTK